jgi:hypothetical protein
MSFRFVAAVAVAVTIGNLEFVRDGIASTAIGQRGKGAPQASQLTEADQRRHDELFRRSGELIHPYMRLTDRREKKASSASADLREGIRLLDDALQLGSALDTGEGIPVAG